MGVRIVEIVVADEIERAGPLLKEHWQELATDKALMVLKPDVARYRQSQEAGVLFGLAAVDDETGAMLGYSVNWIMQNMHYADLRYVQNDVLYIAQAARHAGAGKVLIDATKQVAKARGAQMMIWHAKPNTPLASMLPDLGCRVQDILYSQVL